MKNEQIESQKRSLAEAVERKRNATKERIDYKKAHAPFHAGEAEAFTYAAMWGECRAAKESIRYFSLALAFLRGRRYWEVERTTRNPVSARGVADVTGVPYDAFKEWLAVRPSGEERAEYERHLEAAKARARELRAARKAA